MKRSLQVKLIKSYKLSLKNMMNYYSNSNDVLFDKIQEFTIYKNENPIAYIENSLLHLAELWQSSLPLQPYEYEKIKEFKDCYIVHLQKDGSIKVNSRK